MKRTPEAVEVVVRRRAKERDREMATKVPAIKDPADPSLSESTD